MTRPRVLVLAVLLVALAPAPASAENASVAGGLETTYTGSSGVDNFFLSLNAPPAWIFQRNDAAAALMTAGMNCNDVFADGTRIACQITGGVTVNLNGGDDFVGGGADGHGMTFNGGTGSDKIVPTGNAIHLVNGQSGDDTLLVSAAPNQDTIDGGDGNDTIQFPRGPDDVHGGSGIDRVEVSSGTASWSVTLDDAPNDGASDDFPSNIHSDVEDLTGGAEADTFTGSAQANVLIGGQGNDFVSGGLGQDTLGGGEGDDTIEARDGGPDSVDCGVGNDTATVDPADTVAGCETVRLPDDDGDGITAPQDCDDHDIAIHPGAVDRPGDGIDQDCSGSDESAPPPPDRDGDGSLPPTDCDDGNAAIRPGAVDKPGDGVDQDCNGADARLGIQRTVVQNRWEVGTMRTKVAILAVRNAPRKATVSVSCHGRGCAFDHKALGAGADGKAALTRLFKHRALRPGAVIEVRISAAGYFGKVVRYTVRKGKLPTVKVLCLRSGASKPTASC